jgi:hypothetical protein
MSKKGSLWRKCDLHVHTPLDHEWINKPATTTAESKAAFAKEFIEFAEIQGLDLIAITDHNFCNQLDDLILPHIIKEGVEKAIAVLPGFEITVKDGSGIHILVLFKENSCLQSIHEIVKRLFPLGTDLIPSSGFVPVSDKDLDALKEILDESKIPYLLIFAHADRGSGVLDERTIKGTRRVQEWKKPYINICQLSKGSQHFEPGFLTNVINKTDLNYSRDITYIVASDCRTISTDVTEEGRHYLGQKFTWVKCDPTLEGLKQIVHEPKTRVRIQEEKPEQKNAYLTIDSVRFIETNNKFPVDPIEINSNLNSIIGGKSSGKSLLLYYIAKTIDAKQVTQRLTEMNIENEPYDFHKEVGFDFEVLWSDGETYKLNDRQERKRQITYIPQMYINHVAEHKGDRELDKLVKSILIEKEELRLFFEEERNLIANAKANTASRVLKFFQYKAAIREKQNTIRNKGDKQARKLNLEQKRIELAQLRTDSNFSEEDEASFNLFTGINQINNKRLSRFKMFEATIRNDYQTIITNISSNATDAFESLIVIIQNRYALNSLEDRILMNMLGRHDNALNGVLNSILAELSNHLEKIGSLITIVQERIAYANNELSPFLQKITKKETLAKIQEVIQGEEDQLLQIENLEIELKGLEGLAYQTKIEILEDYKGILNGYQKVTQKVNEEYAIISLEKDISLKAVIGFDKNRFAQNCTTHIDKRTNLSELIGNYFDANNDYIFVEDQHLNNVTAFFDKVLSTALRFNQSGNDTTVCERMFDDYFSIHYELYQKGESIFKMSPGKKGLILMYLILHLSNATYPILIDQPEDNLDNRTVYSELKEFLKSKKVDRQILMVTHNANLVVPTDSENIIVANQSGQDASKDNAVYQFEYVSGALENTFNDEAANGILHQMGIREHVCDILEGGEQAFKERELRYSIA